MINPCNLDEVYEAAQRSVVRIAELPDWVVTVIVNATLATAQVEPDVLDDTVPPLFGEPDDDDPVHELWWLL